jgi:hypothetical protein
MDVSIKGLDAAVVARLAEQAALEGVSAQEWMRETLGRRAALLTPRELDAAVSSRRPVSRERHDKAMAVVGARHTAGLQKQTTRVRNSGR